MEKPRLEGIGGIWMDLEGIGGTLRDLEGLWKSKKLQLLDLFSKELLVQLTNDDICIVER